MTRMKVPWLRQVTLTQTDDWVLRLGWLVFAVWLVLRLDALMRWLASAAPDLTQRVP